MLFCFVLFSCHGVQVDLADVLVAEKWMRVQCIDSCLFSMERWVIQGAQREAGGEEGYLLTVA